MNFGELLTSKTFWLGVSGIVSGIVLIVHGDMISGIQTIGGGLAAIFIKDAIVSSTTTQTTK